MTTTWLAIVNSNAGGLLHKKFNRDFFNKLSTCVTDITYTTHVGDATNIAKNAHHYDGLVVVGGDGTVFEVLNGMNHRHQKLAIIPAGTGNCLARDLGLHNTIDAINIINHGEDISIDLMKVNLILSNNVKRQYWLASTAGVGYVADVAELAKLRFSKMRGGAYAFASTMIFPRHRKFYVSNNEHPHYNSLLTGIIINNTQHIGNTLVFPSADLTDGNFDVLEFSSGWFKQLFHNLQMITQFPIFKVATPRQLKVIHIRNDAPERVILDGELFNDVMEMNIVCHPAAITCRHQTNRLFKKSR